MADTYKIQNATKTDLANSVEDFSVNAMPTDAATQDETYWYFAQAAQNIGYYKSIPEIKQSLISLARWIGGKGYTTETTGTDLTLKAISGWGEDSFDAIMKNMIIMMHIVGDSFAEIIKDDKLKPINLKPISPERIRIVVNKQGIIQRYDYWNSNGWKKIPTNRMLHLCNNRLGDEIHGLSSIDALKWVIDAKQEALEVYRKIMRRNLSMGVMYVKSDDLTKIREMLTLYQEAADKGEVLVLPEDVAKIDNPNLSVQDFLGWINYLDNYFLTAFGVPKVILGGTADYTEASSKIGYLTFEQVYMAEQRELEMDLLNQVGISIKFERPVSLKDNVQEDEAANTGQVGIQPKEAGANLERE